MPRLTAVNRLLRELVARPSVNPTFLYDRPDFTGEERVAELLEEMARSEGIEVRRQSVLPGRKNLIARLKPSGKTRSRVMLTPHMDVVPAPEKDFTPRVRNGKMHGRGTCDTKGSVAAFFSAFLELARKGKRPRETEILFVGLVDEEFGQAGSRMLAKRARREIWLLQENPPDYKSSPPTRATCGSNSRRGANRPTDRPRNTARTPSTRWPLYWNFCSGITRRILA